ncbi:MAG: TIGR02281 family clan AA aspartic protease [Phyllobacteriaceae bacterium]|nr:TIGR02281 family clan AA aspartic protease [Phyllobacteriaceae bacterium]
MLKYTIMFGSLIGMAVAVPFVHQANPQLLGKLFSSAPAPQAQVAYTETPGQSREAASASRGITVAIPMDSRGHFVGSFKIDGHKVAALVDTGATYVALNRSTASRMGMKISASDMRYKVSTANGQANAAAVTINEVAIGKIRVRNVPALVLEDKALDGVLMGMSFLKELERFAIEDRTLILQK